MNSRSEYVEKCKQQFDELQRTGKVLLRYLRNKKRQRTGVIVAYRDIMSNAVYVGVSKCNLSCGDKFNKYVGVEKALEHSVPVVDHQKLSIPHSMQETFNHQLTKIYSYYKELV